MKKTRQLGIAARLILACMLLLSFSLPLTRQSAQASATSPTTQTTLIKPQTPQPAALIQAGNWSDNFDSYATDASMHGQGGWKGWQNNPAGTAYTSDDHAISTPNSVSISAASDLVHEVETGVHVRGGRRDALEADSDAGARPARPPLFGAVLALEYLGLELVFHGRVRARVGSKRRQDGKRRVDLLHAVTLLP